MGWICPCGTENGEGRESCRSCGRVLFQRQESHQPFPPHSPEPSPNYPPQSVCPTPQRPLSSQPFSTSQTRSHSGSKWILAGSVVGGYIGFLMRPAVLLVGQLPLAVVISRGVFLRDLDRLLLPTAQASFNSMLGGAILGAVAAILFSRFA